MTLETRLANLEADHDDLRAAHRAIASEHLAIKAFLNAAAPLLAPSRTDAIRAATVAMDALNHWLDEGVCDDAFQRSAREVLESLSAVLLASAEMAADKSGPRKTT